MKQKHLILLLATILSACSSEPPERRNTTNSRRTTDEIKKTFVDQNAVTSLELALQDMASAKQKMPESSGSFSLGDSSPIVSINLSEAEIKKVADTLPAKLADISTKELSLRNSNLKTDINNNLEASRVEFRNAQEQFKAKETEIAENTGAISSLKTAFESASNDLNSKKLDLQALNASQTPIKEDIRAKQDAFRDVADLTLNQREAHVIDLEKATLALNLATSNFRNQSQNFLSEVDRAAAIQKDLSDNNTKLKISADDFQLTITQFEQSVATVDTTVLKNLQGSLVTFKSTLDNLDVSVSNLDALQIQHKKLITNLELGPLAVINQHISRLQGTITILDDLIAKESRSDVKAQLSEVATLISSSITNLQNATKGIYENIDQQLSLNKNVAIAVTSQKSAVDTQKTIYAQQSTLIGRLGKMVEAQRTILADQKTKAEDFTIILSTQREIIAMQSSLIESFKLVDAANKAMISEADNYIKSVEDFIVVQKQEIQRIKDLINKTVDITQKIIRTPVEFRVMVDTLLTTPGDYTLGNDLDLEGYTFDTLALVNAQIDGKGFRIKNLVLTSLTLASDRVRPNLKDIVLEGFYAKNYNIDNGVLSGAQIFWMGVTRDSQQVFWSGTPLNILNSYLRLGSLEGTTRVFSVSGSVIESDKLYATSLKNSYVRILGQQDVARVSNTSADYVGNYIDTGDVPVAFAGICTLDSRIYLHFSDGICAGLSTGLQNQIGFIRDKWPNDTRVQSGNGLNLTEESGVLSIVTSKLGDAQVVKDGKSPNTTFLDRNYWFIPDVANQNMRDAVVFSKAKGLGQAWDLQRHFKFKTSTRRATNWGGKNEKWFDADDGNLYFALPQNSGLYRYKTGTTSDFIALAEFVAHIHPDMITTPAQLFKLWRHDSIHQLSTQLKTSTGAVAEPGRQHSDIHNVLLTTRNSKNLFIKTNSDQTFGLSEFGNLYSTPINRRESDKFKFKFAGSNYLLKRRFSLDQPFVYCSPNQNRISPFPPVLTPTSTPFLYTKQVFTAGDFDQIDSIGRQYTLCQDVDLLGKPARTAYADVAGNNFTIKNVATMNWGFSDIKIINSDWPLQNCSNCVAENAKNPFGSSLKDPFGNYLQYEFSPYDFSMTNAVESVQINEQINSDRNNYYEPLLKLHSTNNTTIIGAKFEVNCSNSDSNDIPSTIVPINFLQALNFWSSYRMITFKDVDIYIRCKKNSKFSFEPRLFEARFYQYKQNQHLGRNFTDFRLDNIRIHFDDPELAAQYDDAYWSKENQFKLSKYDTLDLKSADLTVISGGNSKRC